MLPLVALVGRPNVGKSTIFNALTRTRDALVHDQPGVTRDRNYGVCRLDEDNHFLVVDTGGIAEEEEGLAGATTRQARAAAAEADLILFVVDARDGSSAMDDEILAWLRKLSRPTLLLINKIDGTDEDSVRSEFARYGFSEMLTVSAAHRQGLDDLLEEVVQRLPEEGSGEELDNDPNRIRIAFVGRPNVGKSTLTNALVGAKVSIVSNRPQTTRHRLLGIATYPEGQLVLVDTPGLHKVQKRAMNRVMNRAARGSLEGVDAGLLVIEAGRWDEEDSLAFNVLRDAGIPVVLVVNKIDRLKDKGALLPFLQEVTAGRDFSSVHPISAQKRNGLEALVRDVLALLPEAPPMFGEDEITDRSQRFLAGELVREQLMRQLGEELPYATTVEIERFTEDGNLLRIGAVIWVEREGQKAIVIGKGGTRLKEIGAKSRLQMERLFGAKVFLETWVRVREGWSDDEAALKAFGYE